MIKHYLHIFYRNIFKYKTYTWVNIFGLSFSIAAIILLLLYIKFEYSFDNFHSDKNQIYRISIQSYHEGKYEDESYVFTPPIGVDLKNDYSEIEDYTRYATPRNLFVMHQNKPVKIQQTLYADSTFFRFFSFDLLQGDASKVLQKPNEIVLTEKVANRLFGRTDVVGKTLTDNQKNSYTITGIAKNPPKNSSIQFNALLSFATLYQNPNNYMDWNGGNQYITFIKLKKSVLPTLFEKKLPDFLWRHINKELASVNVAYTAHLQALDDIHLKYGKGYRGIYFFSIIGLLILLMATFNFINLSTVYYSKRAKSIGVRKTLGASPKAVGIQFFVETALIVLISLVLGLLLAYFFTPYYRHLMQSDFYGIRLDQPGTILMLLGLWILISLLAGSYPALYLSGIKVTDLLKNTVSHKKSRFNLQNTLIILQFMVAVALIIFTLVIKQQLHFINHKNLGYDKEQIVIIPLNDQKSGQQTALIKDRLKAIPGLIGITASSDIPGSGFTSNGYFVEGMETPAMVNVLDVDKDFLKTYGISVVKGRNFSKEYPTDKSAFLVNEAFVKQFGWQHPLNKTIKRGVTHPVIGVIKNFNYASLRQNIQPLIITNTPWHNTYDYLSVKINSKNYKSVLKSIEKTWHQINPEWAFEYEFLDKKFERVYREDYNMMQLFIYFSILAIVIASLGLYSLSALTIEQRTKEIGIRKVFGASLTEILQLVSKKYVIMVLIANILVWPVIFLWLKKWLNGFANRIEISIAFFVIGGLLTLCIALFSVTIKSLSIAKQNPSLSLRNE